MKIATKLVVFFASVVVLFVLLAAVMLQQLRAVTDGYQELLSGQVSQIEMARVIQVDFKKQVQEWKDILLRGYSPEDLGKYTRQFHSQETQVQQGAKSLVQTVQDSSARELLLQFLAAHETMGQKYEAAYNSYVSGNFDFKAADKMVRGQDREATDLFDKVVLRLNDSVESSIAAQKTAVRRSLTFVLVFFGA
ncbi:MAG TPA: MCP four helix bundle domain-containing protein, partial [Candidatus Acidoferrum sp.]|nr:MCP four helix bundle domain-containing protein [Candidatus Acidoferrum sp.]